MAIKENVHYEETDARIKNEECMVAKLTGETGHHQILCCVYNPPKNSKIPMETTKLHQFVRKLNKNYKYNTQCRLREIKILNTLIEK